MSEFISSLIVEDVRVKSKKRALDIVTDRNREYGLDISYHQTWWAMDKAMSDIFCDYQTSFFSLKWYVGAA